MDKYKELIEALNSVDTSGMCPCEKEALCEEKDCIVFQAADAIQELTRRNENQAGTITSLFRIKDKIINEASRRDKTDGEVKVFSRKEIISIVEKVWKY